MTQPLRLADLEPDDVAASVTLAARALVAALAEQLAPGVEWIERKNPRPERARLAASVGALVRYAKQGGDVEEARELVRELSSTLHRRIVDGAAASDVDQADELEVVTTPIGLALAATRTRIDLAANRPVRAAQLAALANVDASAIRRLVAAGELEAERLPSKAGGAQIRAAVARRWLASRGVPGFAKV